MRSRCIPGFMHPPIQQPYSTSVPLRYKARRVRLPSVAFPGLSRHKRGMRCTRLLAVVALCSVCSIATSVAAEPTTPQHDAKAAEHYAEGTRLGDRGDHAGAIKQLQEAVQIEPGWLEPRNDLGVELYLTGDAAAAAEQLRAAAKIDSERGTVHVNLAFALYDLGQIDEAVKAWREALEHGARVADAYAGLALGLYKQGHVDEALRMYQIAIDQDKNYAQVEHLGAGAGWSPHAVADAAVVLRALQKPRTASSTPASR